MLTSLKTFFKSKSNSYQVTSRNADSSVQHIRVGKSTRRTIEGPFPYTPKSQDEKPAGEGVSGVCTQFYSDKYNDDKIARSYIKKTFKHSDFCETPEMLARITEMHHPHIVEYIHSSEEDSSIIMRESEEDSSIIMRDAGRSLTAYLDQLREKSMQLSFCEDLYIYLKLLTAVMDLKHAGISHRDLHEGNVAIQKDGTVKVIDFGGAINVKVNANDNTTILDTLALYHWLCSILERHSKIKTSGNIDEKNHYKMLSKWSKWSKFRDLYIPDLISKLKTMHAYFPNWGNESVPPKTDFAHVHELQERFRANHHQTHLQRRQLGAFGFLKRRD